MSDRTGQPLRFRGFTDGELNVMYVSLIERHLAQQVGRIPANDITRLLMDEAGREVSRRQRRDATDCAHAPEVLLAGLESWRNIAKHYERRLMTIAASGSLEQAVERAQDALDDAGYFAVTPEGPIE